MPDFYSPSPSGNFTDVRQSGTIIKVIKKNNNTFKVFKTNKPTISATISLTATPGGGPGTVTSWTVDYIDSETTTNDSLDRSDTALPGLNSNIYIFDTDIVSFFVKPKISSNAGDTFPLFITPNAASYPYSPVEVGSIENNGQTSGLLQWNPGVGNTGVFAYRWKDSSNAVGGSIHVTSTP